MDLHLFPDRCTGCRRILWPALSRGTWPISFPTLGVVERGLHPGEYGRRSAAGGGQCILSAGSGGRSPVAPMGHGATSPGRELSGATSPLAAPHAPPYLAAVSPAEPPSEHPRRVLVLGGTGQTGRHICAELAARDLPFCVVARDPAAAEGLPAGAVVVRGDVLDPDTLQAALGEEPVTDVIIALGDRSLGKTTLRSGGTHNIIEALEKSGNQATLHVISAFGVNESWSRLRWSDKLISWLFIKGVMADHGVQEDLVTASGLPYHIVRPVGLKDDESAGEVRVQDTGSLPGRTIQRVDLARFMVDGLVAGRQGVSAVYQA